MKKAIVTGAGGFLGQALVQELRRGGTQVIAVKRGSQGQSVADASSDGVTTVYCDLAHMKELPERLDCRDVDVFYHFAWSGTSGQQRGDVSLQLDNAKFTCDAVRAAKALGCKRFIFAASIMEYECHQTISADKTTGPGMIYSTGKLAADYMACAVADEVGIAYSAVVISNIYGPGERSPRLVNTTIRKLLTGESVPCTAGEQMYDFVYITDAVAAFARLSNIEELRLRYYLGSLSPRPLKRFLTELSSCIKCGKLMLGDLPFHGISLDYDQFLPISIWKHLDMAPETDFVTGVNKMVEWIKENV